MNQLAHALWRLVVIFTGLVLATAAAAIVTLIAVTPPAIEINSIEDQAYFFEHYLLIGFAGFFVLGTLAGPALFAVIAVAEAMRIRNWLYYVVGGGICGAAGMAFWDSDKYDQQEIAIVMAAGFAAGLIYWAIAGRGAGIIYKKPEWPVTKADAPPKA